MKINGKDVALISMNNVGFDLVMKMYSTPQMTKCPCCNGDGVHEQEISAADFMSSELAVLFFGDDGDEVVGIELRPCTACMCKGMVSYISYN